MPVSGATVYSAGSMLSISISYPTVSMAYLLPRAKFWSAAVVNDGVKKKPLIQKMVGWPSWYHPRRGQPGEQVLHVARQRFEARERFPHPRRGNLSDGEGVEHLLELGAHH